MGGDQEPTLSGDQVEEALISRRRVGKGILLSASALAAAAVVSDGEVAHAAPGTDPWRLGGNTISTDGSNFLGTKNAAPLIFKTTKGAAGPIERMRIGTSGNVGIGTNSPQGLLHSKANSVAPAVLGENLSTAQGAVGVHGKLTSTGAGQDSAGVLGTNATTNSFGAGVKGTHAGSGYGVHGSSPNIGVRGDAFPGVTGVFPTGVYGSGTGYSAYGVVADAVGPGSPRGLWATASSTEAQTAYAGVFGGHVVVQGTLSKSAGSFRTDHPLDPENKYLSHSFVESPDMMNVYNGNVTLDDNGAAEVTLPEWFEALNRDFRYQLTPIGAAAVVYIAEEITGNRFTIAGGTAGMKVSWQVTGIRQDAYANANRIPVEEDKRVEERGKYLHPREHGKPESAGVDFERIAKLRESGSREHLEQPQPVSAPAP
jgi:hypothetical protein